MPSLLPTRRRITAAAVALTLIVPTSLVLSATPTAAPPPATAPRATTPPPPPAPVRNVALVRPKTELWPDRIEASGNIMPWHETAISTEVGGLRLVSVLVSEGETVKKGQVLARLNAATVETDLDVTNAQLAEAEAVLAQAAATLERANRLAPSGGVSRQELTLYETQKHTAEARLNAARAQVKRQQLKLEFATLSAPDDGVISSSSASEGSIVQAGSELFRLIRQGRLEWRAEIKGELLMKLAAGQEVLIKSPLGPEVKGRIRRVSPTVDVKTRNGLAYVDLPAGTDLKAGLNVSGSIGLGKRKALVIPASAVLSQGGTTRVFKLDADNKLEAIEVKTGRVRDDWVEILSGLDDHTPVVARDLKPLKEGELVKAAALAPEVVQQ
ncbi:MAG: efflux transporter, family, subunit [Proteobacteria bacterium]|nr:efflux transporter, family, subunit [Pseudomonadota bacterium]